MKGAKVSLSPNELFVVINLKGIADETLITKFKSSGIVTCLLHDEGFQISGFINQYYTKDEAVTMTEELLIELGYELR